VSYRLRLRNRSGLPVDGLQFSVLISGGLAVTSPGTLTNCGPGTGGVGPSGQFAMNNVSIAAGDTCEMIVPLLTTGISAPVSGSVSIGSILSVGTGCSTGCPVLRESISASFDAHPATSLFTFSDASSGSQPGVNDYLNLSNASVGGGVRVTNNNNSPVTLNGVTSSPASDFNLSAGSPTNCLASPSPTLNPGESCVVNASVANLPSIDTTFNNKRLRFDFGGVSIGYTVFGFTSYKPIPSLSFADSTIAIGVSTNLTIRITNPTDFFMSNLAFNMPLPAQYASSSLVSNTCGGSVTTGTNVILTNGHLLASPDPSNLYACEIVVSVTGVGPGGGNVILSSNPNGGGGQNPITQDPTAFFVGTDSWITAQAPLTVTGSPLTANVSVTDAAATTIASCTVSPCTFVMPRLSPSTSNKDAWEFADITFANPSGSDFTIAAPSVPANLELVYNSCATSATAAFSVLAGGLCKMRLRYGSINTRYNALATETLSLSDTTTGTTMNIILSYRTGPRLRQS
jgi:hypothetical protein